MKLITKELEKRFAELGPQTEEIDPIVVTKFFDPEGSATWCIISYDPDDNIAVGYVQGLYPGDWNDELGSFCIEELESVIPSSITPIERDLSFKEMPLSQAMPDLKEKIDKAKKEIELNQIEQDKKQKRERGLEL